MLTRQDPFRDALSLRRAMDQLLEQSVIPNLMGMGGPASVIAPMDLCETAMGYEVDVAIPGVKPEDIELTVDQNSLTIRGHYSHMEEHWKQQQSDQSQTMQQPQAQATQQPQVPVGQQPQAQATQQPQVPVGQQPQAPVGQQPQAQAIQQHPQAHVGHHQQKISWLTREIPSGSFERTINFARPIDPDKVGTRYEYGILTISVPVSEASRPKRISISGGPSEQRTIEAGRQ